MTKQTKAVHGFSPAMPRRCPRQTYRQQYLAYQRRRYQTHREQRRYAEVKE